MGKIKLLLDVVSDIRSLADSLQAVADVMVQNEPAVDMAAEEKAEPEKKADTKPAGKSAGKKKAAAEPEEQPLTLEEVRAVLAEKSRAGHTAEVNCHCQGYESVRTELPASGILYRNAFSSKGCTVYRYQR